MSIENPTLAHFRHFSPLFTNLPSTSVENVLQISHILFKTKPICWTLKLTQSFYLQRFTKTYPFWGFGKTKPIKANNQSLLIDNHLKGKPNSKPIKPNFGPISRVANPIQTQIKACPERSRMGQFKLVLGVCFLAFLPGIYPRMS